ncbi:oligosaccharyl transferase, archaeosortase A system-associated [Natrinema halophilum]|uniref:dolichyl-phosphooligosaccharide-protein glycotransferase n=1 Tax=Natrinema halophilum TaxID=1699371 RepID=A0A7D5GH84_9EURY|nr:oligosaccharyl transferase, archaeosortase A system-associated [Natrinema halophilum]QLG48874.1 oligosaccharyl transferase, archaeosortase A system-associated [Natrinema halophilum]
MSTDTEHVEEGAVTSVLESWRDWYHLPVIGLVMLFMVWVRTQSYDRFVTNDGTPALAGIDSWYHWRTINWTAENYPHTMPYEVWTGFPTGNYVGQFGTLYDQLIVTVAMIVGLGDPSAETLYAVSLLSIPIMAALVAVPVFYAGRRLGGTLGGIVSVLVLALTKGQFLARSTVGQLDHHIGEVLFMAIAVVAMMVALTVGEREKPVYELVVDRDWTALRTPAIYSALAGLALTLYIWVWPAGILLIGIFGIFFTIQLILDYVRGISPDHIAFTGVVSFGLTAFLTMLLIEQPGFSTTSFSFLQPLAALFVAAGCLFMAWLAREWNKRGLERHYYPAAVGGIIIAVLAVMWLALPSLFNTLVGNLTSRLLPLNPSTGTLTIVEAQPPDNFFNTVFAEFGSAFYTMLAGLAFLAIRPLLGRNYRTEHTLVIVWTLFLISMAATQVRFMYYLVLAVAIVNAAFVSELAQLFDLDLESSLESVKQVETYQVIVVFLVVLLLFAPLLPPLAQATAWDHAEATGPQSDAMLWEESTHWLKDNTPTPGNYGGANNGDELDYYGTYTPGDGDYEYPEGAYGVMSWWDYGHLITTQGERIPHSNPFQQNARTSSAFLTAQSEERAELILDGISEDQPVVGRSTEELRQSVSGNDSSEQEEMRYVMIDSQMASGKFNAITEWTGPDYSHYYGGEQFQLGENQSRTLPSANSNYDNTTMSSLYLQDATGMEHYRLVHENDNYAIVGSMAVGGQVRPHHSVGLRETGWTNQTQAISDGLTQARTNNQVFQGLRTPMWDAHVVSSVKTFERVEGATITGSVNDAAGIDAGTATAVVAVELETDTGRTFIYRQQAELADDGSFEVTVPYATNDELSVEDGYTDSSVEATGNYTATVLSTGGQEPTYYSGQTAVPETAVVNGESIDVSLEEVESPPNNETGGNETGGNETGGNETDGSTDSGNSSSSDDGATADETTNTVAPVAAKPAH